jgi:putative SOS response-associated peptidase YedK
MCGRFYISESATALAERLDAELAASATELDANWDTRPSQASACLIEHRGALRLGPMSWGWQRSWNSGKALINARSETAHEKATYRDAWAQRRCLIPADGWYEWRVDDRQCHRISPLGGERLLMAALWEKTEQGPAFVICTTAAAEHIAPIHKRMPVCLSADSGRAWLGGAELEPLHDFQAEAIAKPMAPAKPTPPTAEPSP